MRWLLVVAAAVLVLLLTGAGMMAWRSGALDCCISRADAEAESNWILEFCARAGHTPSQAWLGIMYWSDAGGDARRFTTLSEQEILQRGRAWMETAAANGSPIAQNELGLAYLDGDFGVPQDLRLARHWLEAATRGGDEIAPLNLARMYYNGEGVPQSEQNAEAMLRLSADRGYFDGRCSLAALLERRGVVANQAEIERLRRPSDDPFNMRVCTDNDLMRGLEPTSAGNGASP